MKIIIVGGNGTLGSAVARELSSRHEVVICGRKNAPVICDISSEDSIRQMFEKVEKFDALIATAGHVHFEDLENMNSDKYMIGLMNKLMGQVNLVSIGKKFINDNGSFTLTSGILNCDPIKTGSSGAMVNGAIEGFVRGAAIELKRGIRLNVVSPTVLAESMKKYENYFRGFKPVSAQEAALAYAKSVEGLQTGQVYRIGYTSRN